VMNQKKMKRNFLSVGRIQYSILLDGMKCQSQGTESVILEEKEGSSTLET
jgi:hypothetical protein